MRIVFLFCFLSFISFSQNKSIDVLNYQVHIDLFDSTNRVVVEESIDLTLLDSVDVVRLDLVGLNDEGYGMEVNSVVVDSVNCEFQHDEDVLSVQKKFTLGDTIRLILQYSGVPENGLIIGKNKFGNRTFFADNWPNRAHYWLASNDHPADKATVQFQINAPSHYECIATGVRVDKKETNGRTTHFYSSTIPLPTKVMVFGVADFSINQIEHEYDFELTSWVYPQNETEGFSDMKVAKEVLSFFIRYVGEYPFEKLANVQSKTMFGGMENAGNIFYDENAITGKGTMEALIAHEIAHQWFGNSASEVDWQHLWLSEGFATYLTDLYWLKTYGKSAFNERLIQERNRVVQFSKKYIHPVVDTTYSRLFDLLNPNSYQKGAWFLHMLRMKIGDEAFHEVIRQYYSLFKFNNASTEDFMNVVESIVNIDLSNFFYQWLYIPDQPVIKVSRVGKQQNQLKMEQLQAFVFHFPLEVEYLFKDGTTQLESYRIDKQEVIFDIPKSKSIVQIRIDPHVKLLFELVKDEQIR